MDIQKLEKQIKVLKSEVQKALKEGAAPLAVRKSRKQLKRAQRKKNCIEKRAAFIASKMKKEAPKEEKAAEKNQEEEAKGKEEKDQKEAK